MIYLSTIGLTFLLTGIFTSRPLIELGQLLLIIPMIKCLWDSYKQKNLGLPTSAYWLLAFIVIALISLWVNADDVQKMSNVRSKLKYPLYGVIGIYFLRYWVRESSDQIKKWVLNIFLVSVLFSSIYGIVTYFLDDLHRLNGLIYTSKQAYGSLYFLAILFGVLLHHKKFQNILSTRFALLTFTVCLIAMIMTYARGAVLGLLISMPISLFFYRKKIAYIMGATSILVALIMGGYYFFGKTNTSFRFLITKTNNSDSMRKSIWLASVMAIKERPLLGWGYFNFKHQVERIKNQYDLPRKDFVDSHSHNNFLEIAAGTGLFGLFAFLGWFFSWGLESFKSPWRRALIIPFWVSFFITSQVDMTIIDYHLSALIYFIYSFSSIQFKKFDDTQA